MPADRNRFRTAGMSVSISASELFHAIHEIRLARCSLFRVFQRITQCAESDTLIVARHAPVFQHLFALGGIKDFFCTVYPATSQSHGVGGGSRLPITSEPS